MIFSLFLFFQFYQGSESFTTVKNIKSPNYQDGEYLTSDREDPEGESFYRLKAMLVKDFLYTPSISRAVIMSPAISSKSLYLRETIWHG
jgi:hypothetical protein